MCWVLVAYLTIRLCESENPRWWLGIGAAIGLGMMTKYTMAFCVAGIWVGVILTDTRRYLSSPWLWGGMALSLLIFLPNLIWQIEHDFISLDFLRSIHERDARMGRTRGFLIEQFIGCANPLTIQFVVLGLYFYFVLPQGKNYRLLGWMYVVPIVLSSLLSRVPITWPRPIPAYRHWRRRLGTMACFAVGDIGSTRPRNDMACPGD